MGWALVLGLGLVLHTIVNELLNSASRCIASFKTTQSNPKRDWGWAKVRPSCAGIAMGFYIFDAAKDKGMVFWLVITMSSSMCHIRQAQIDLEFVLKRWRQRPSCRHIVMFIEPFDLENQYNNNSCATGFRFLVCFSELFADLPALFQIEESKR